MIPFHILTEWYPKILRIIFNINDKLSYAKRYSYIFGPSIIDTGAHFTIKTLFKGMKFLTIMITKLWERLILISEFLSQ